LIEKIYLKGGVRGLVTFREGTSTLNIRSTHLSTLFNFLCKLELKKEKPNYLHFIDSEGLGPLPTYP